jgi:hypothetical protein
MMLSLRDVSRRRFRSNVERNLFTEKGYVCCPTFNGLSVRRGVKRSQNGASSCYQVQDWSPHFAALVSITSYTHL